MFWRRNVETESLREDVKLLEAANKSLKEDNIKLKTEHEELKLKKRLEQEEIVHMQKINKERLEAQIETKKIELERKHVESLSKFKEEQRVALVDSLREFHTKMEKRSDDEVKRIQQMYDSIMNIMPKVNLMLEKKVK